MNFAPGQRVTLKRSRSTVAVGAVGTIVGEVLVDGYYLVDFDQYPNLAGGWRVQGEDLAPENESGVSR